MDTASKLCQSLCSFWKGRGLVNKTQHPQLSILKHPSVCQQLLARGGSGRPTQQAGGDADTNPLQCSLGRKKKKRGGEASRAAGGATRVGNKAVQPSLLVILSFILQGYFAVQAKKPRPLLCESAFIIHKCCWIQWERRYHCCIRLTVSSVYCYSK